MDIINEQKERIDELEWRNKHLTAYLESTIGPMSVQRDIKRLKEENERLKEETERLKGLKEEGEWLKEETEWLKEETLVPDLKQAINAVINNKELSNRQKRKMDRKMKSKSWK